MTSRSNRIRAASGALPSFEVPGLDGGTFFPSTLRVNGSGIPDNPRGGEVLNSL